MRRLAIVSPLLLALLILVPSNDAFAQTSTTTSSGSGGTSGIGWRGWGLRAGVGADPDQVFGGVHFNLGEFARDVRFRPTIEMGFGDDVTTLQALAEVHYVFSNVQVWKPYVGGGLGLAYISVDDDEEFGDLSDDSDTDISFAAMGGVESKLRSGNTIGFEGKIGFGDYDHDFKASINWSF